eukprot:2550375-Lingulodinium_polyedra.AAC.1
MESSQGSRKEDDPDAERVAKVKKIRADAKRFVMTFVSQEVELTKRMMSFAENAYLGLLPLT